MTAWGYKPSPKTRLTEKVYALILRAAPTGVGESVGKKTKANYLVCFVFFLLLTEPYTAQGEGWI